MSKTIFISYSSRNRGAVEALASDLKSVGFAVWYDRELSGGNDWWATILDNIRRCDLFVFGLTMQWMNSYPSKLETEYALALGKPLLPVVLGRVNINLLPSTMQRLQFVDYQEADKDQFIGLWKAISGMPPAPALPSPLPTPPAVPLSPFATLADRVGARILNRSEQEALVEEFRRLLQNPETAAEAKEWLGQFRQ